jgi:hypothetical protein
MREEKKKMEMPLKHETVKGTFIDYRGMERDFTMVAVTIPIKSWNSKVVVSLMEEMYQSKNETISNSEEIETGYMYTDFAEVRKMLSIGVAVRCNRDKDLGLGEYIAYGKAIRSASEPYGHVIFVTHTGMINTKMVQALLEQESEHFKKDPGAYIKGYNSDRDRYNKTGKIAIAEMTEDEIQKMKAMEEIEKTNNAIEKKEYKGTTVNKTVSTQSPKTIVESASEPVEPVVNYTTISSEPAVEVTDDSYKANTNIEEVAEDDSQVTGIEDVLGSARHVQKKGNYIKNRLNLGKK